MTQTDLIGKTVLGYRVEKKLGSGAFGTVYQAVKAEDIRALKHITFPTEKQYTSVLNALGGDIEKTNRYFEEMQNRVVAEIEILKTLSEKKAHSIVKYYESDRIVTASPCRYEIFILMEYLKPFGKFLQENRRFCVRDVVQLGVNLLEGIRSCHENGVIHRDIKEDNIFVSESGAYKIGDFGVSKLLKNNSKAESLKGTPDFLAPEVYRGTKGYTKSVDLYAVGIVLYRLLNFNRNPFLPVFPEQFFSYDEDLAFERRMNGEQPELPALGGEKIGGVICQAIADSSRRFQTADEFLHALKMAAEHTIEEILQRSVIAQNFPKKVTEKAAKGYRATLNEELPPMVQKEEPQKSCSVNQYLFSGEDFEDSVSAMEQTEKLEEIKRPKFGAADNLLTKRKIQQLTQRITKGLRKIRTKEILNTLDREELNSVIWALSEVQTRLSEQSCFGYRSIGMLQCEKYMISNLEKLEHEIQYGWDSSPEKQASLFRMSKWISNIDALQKKRMELKEHTQLEDSIAESIFRIEKPQQLILIHDAMEELKNIRRRNNIGELNAEIYKLERLGEKIFAEKDWGTGNDKLISSEKNIILQLYCLQSAIRELQEESTNRENAVSAIAEAVSNLNRAVFERMEWKKVSDEEENDA